MSTKMTGLVKWFDAGKGFGFITPADGGKDVFVHSTGLKDEIKEGDEVTFDTASGKKGINAINVKRTA